MSEFLSQNHNRQLDNTVRFRELKEYAQVTADLLSEVEGPVQVDSLDGLGADVDISPLIGVPVEIENGTTLSMGINQESSEVIRLFVSHDSTVGVYAGIAWMPQGVKSDGHQNYVLCHVLEGEVNKYMDDMGRRHTVENFTYVSIADSDVTLLSQQNSHSYEVIANDGFCQKLDEIALDETMSTIEKLHLLKEMFGTFPTEDFDTTLARDRLSYLNHLDIFGGVTAAVSTAYLRDNNDTIRVLQHKQKNNLGSIVAQISHVGFDYPLVAMDEELIGFNSSRRELCLEGLIAGNGQPASFPIDDSLRIIG